jgi:hypothetical protein
MMHPEIRNLLYDAEIAYLQTSDLKRFKAVVASLQKRMETYQCLRDREIEIFQPIADQLIEAFPKENPRLIERALKHWLSVMRYCAMAMLLNNPEFLQHRLLEWLTDIVQVNQMSAIENYLCESLQFSLKHTLSAEQLLSIEPFLEQAKATLLESKSPSELLK